MPRYNVSAELTVDDRSPFAYVEADSEEEARELAREIYGTPDAWEFHVLDGTVEVFVSLAKPVDDAQDPQEVE